MTKSDFEDSKVTKSEIDRQMEATSEGALSVLRRGVAASPELRQGLAATVLMGLSIAIGRLIIPILIERTIDGVSIDESGQTVVDRSTISSAVVVALIIIVVSGITSWAAQRRLVVRAEAAIAGLRVNAFRRVHELSIADHNETQRGVLVARVTSDADALARFAQWGLFAWSIHPTVIVGTVAVLAFYSWPLAIIVVLAYAPVIPLLRWLQRRQLAAYDIVRTRVSEMLTGFSEAVMGAAVVRAYGVENRTRDRLHNGINARYSARIKANRFQAGVFVVGDMFGAVAFSSVLVVGLLYREQLGLDAGELVGCLFLTSLLNGPIGELGETLDQTQTAVAGWRKILDLLDQRTDVPEPVDGEVVPAGPVAIDAEHITFSYRDGAPVLRDVSVSIPAGTNVAIVGETGSGKTTFAKLLCRLADPSSGTISLNGVVLTDVAPEARLKTVRMVPQDGFLFETSIGENIRFGRPGATTAEILETVDSLGLRWWLDRLGQGDAEQGLELLVGERGGSLSVGERQLVALVRAALADPGLLILDEATSAVDPETDQALTTAIRRLAEGRTLISIAHRLATAIAADHVLVFDAGQLVESGHHDELVEAGGIYSGLYRAWIGNTSTTQSPDLAHDGV